MVRGIFRLYFDIDNGLFGMVIITSGCPPAASPPVVEPRGGNVGWLVDMRLKME